MKLQENEINLILKGFPLLHSELSYEIITHKKVHNSDIILAIPEGKKCFTWFTNYNSENVCFLLELDCTHEIENIKIVTTGFDNSLTIGAGTIFYGTLFSYNSINCFCIEDIYYYKSKNYIYVPYLTKLETLSKILKTEMSQSVLNGQFTIFGMPLINKDFDNLLRDIQMLPYKISQIKHRFFDKNSCRKILTMNYFKPGKQYGTHNVSKKIISNVIFKVTADIEPDIYNLFIYKNGQEEYYGVAFIPDYKTSVMMNKLFRKIKENENLDAIEESDTEDEFENVKEDKFVHLDRSYKFRCEYNHKFNRWCPVSLADEKDKIVSSNILNNY